MGRFMTALLGVVAGFFLAHFLSQTDEGRQFFSRIRATVASFTKGFSETFRP
jgi:hypothetical protein